MPPHKCGICASSAKKRTYPTDKYESEIFECFGVRLQSSGRICNSCYGCILKFKTDGTLRPDRVDCQGKIGQGGHLQIGGKRKAISAPTKPVVTDTVSNSRRFLK